SRHSTRLSYAPEPGGKFNSSPTLGKRESSEIAFRSALRLPARLFPLRITGHPRPRDGGPTPASQRRRTFRQGISPRFCLARTTEPYHFRARPQFADPDFFHYLFIIMAVALRLNRQGTKDRPYYKIVAVDSRKRRDGRFIDHVGTYAPMKEGTN